MAPSEDAAATRLAQHIVDCHAEEVDVDIPEGMVQVRRAGGDEWVTMPAEAAVALQHADEPTDPGAEESE